MTEDELAQIPTAVPQGKLVVLDLFPPFIAAIRARFRAVQATGGRVPFACWRLPSAFAACFEPLAMRLETLSDPGGFGAAMAQDIPVWRRFGDAFAYRLVVLEPR